MRRMNRSQAREWTPGEPVERVRFDDGTTGMDKRCPRDDSDHGLTRLQWKCAATLADGGPRLTVNASDYRINGNPQTGYFDVNTETGSCGPLTLDEAWSYINGIARGYRLASTGKRHRPGLYDTLRTVLNGMSGSSSHRHDTVTGNGPLTMYSIVSDGSKESGSTVRGMNMTPGSAQTMDSTYTRRDPVTSMRRREPCSHSASPNGGLSNAARCMAVCSSTLAAWACSTATCLSSIPMSSRRSASRLRELRCSITQPTTVTTTVSSHPANSTPCSANHSMTRTLPPKGAPR